MPLSLTANQRLNEFIPPGAMVSMPGGLLPSGASRMPTRFWP